MNLEKQWDDNYKKFRMDNPLIWPDTDFVRLVSRAGNHDFSRILDYGCGEGRNSRFLIEKFPEAKIVCSDTSGCAIEIVRNLYGSRVSSMHVDESLKGGLYDLIICWGVTHYVDDVVGLLKKIRSSINKGGALVISFQGEKDSRSRMADLKRLFSQADADKIMNESSFETKESGVSFGHSFQDGATWHLYWFRAIAK